MASIFSIGDSVTFINEKQNGIVIGFKSNSIVVVEIEDGFTLDVLSKEIVLIQAAQEKAMGVNNSSLDIVDKQVVINNTPEYSNYIDGNKITVLAIPEASAVLSGSIKLLLCNPSKGQIQGYLFEKRKDGLQRVANFSVEKNNQKELSEYSRDGLMNIDSFLIAYTWSEENSFTSSSKDFTIEYPGLLQNYPTLAAPYCFATSHDILAITDDNFEIDLDLLKDKFQIEGNKSVKSQKANAVKSRKDDMNLLRRYGLSGVNSIVDLHIEALIEYPEGYSSSELIRIQLNHFRSELDKAMVAKMHTIVFIHGVGNGKLKEAIHSELKELELKYRPADFSKYGIGATEVLLS